MLLKDDIILSKPSIIANIENVHNAFYIIQWLLFKRQAQNIILLWYLPNIVWIILY